MDIERLRRLSREATAHDQGIAAVILFGSRSRRTHRPDSDWDIAVFGGEGHDEWPGEEVQVHRLDVT